jgi:hypothetical protein
MGNLASQQLSTQTDPDVVRRQILAEREKQLSGISNPQQQLAARLGGLLGGGLVNLYQDKGFFEVNDPLLTKVTQIQGIYNDVAGRIDPAADPMSFFSELQKAYGDAGLGREALAAAQEAQKAKKENLSFESAQFELFNKNPELLDREIIKAENAGDEEKVSQLASLKQRVTDARQLEMDYKKAQIEQAKTTAAVQRATAEGKDIVYVPDIVTGKNLPYKREGDKLVPLVIEGVTNAPAPGTGQGKFSQAKKGVYNPQTGKVEYK